MATQTIAMSLLMLIALAATAYGANHSHTHAPHGTHTHRPTVISNSLKFYYEPEQHYVIAVSDTTCFMAALTRDEIDHVHTSAGIEDIELRMVREWIGQLAETKIYHDDPLIPANVQNWCRHQDIYLLARNIGTQGTTPVSALG